MRSHARAAAIPADHAAASHGVSAPRLHPLRVWLSEIAYALTSTTQSNGSAFGGFTGNTPFYNELLAVVMLAGRYLRIVLVLALAGSLARQRRGVVTAGTLPLWVPKT